MWPFKKRTLKLRQKELDSISNQLDILYSKKEILQDVYEKITKGDVTSLLSARNIVETEYLALMQQISHLMKRSSSIMEEQSKFNNINKK